MSLRVMPKLATLAFAASAAAWLHVSSRSRSVPISSIGTTFPKYAPPASWHDAHFAS